MEMKGYVFPTCVGEPLPLIPERCVQRVPHLRGGDRILAHHGNAVSVFPTCVGVSRSSTTSGEPNLVFPTCVGVNRLPLLQSL